MDEGRHQSFFGLFRFTYRVWRANLMPLLAVGLLAAAVAVTVLFQRPSKAARPLAFAGVTNDEVSLARSAYTGDPLLPGIKNLNAGPQTVGGLRLMEDEYLQAYGDVHWHRFMLDSSRLTLASNLDIEGGFQVSQASTEGSIVTAIIASMRFNQPKG